MISPYLPSPLDITLHPESLEWIPLNINPVELRLDTTLINGQTFSWYELPPDFTIQFPLPTLLTTTITPTTITKQVNKDIDSSRAEIAKNNTLVNKNQTLDYWGTLGSHAVIFRQTIDNTYYCHLGTHTESFLRHEEQKLKLVDDQLLQKISDDVTLEYIKKILHQDILEYFYLDTSTFIPNSAFYNIWSETDKLFNTMAPYLPGLRLLRQDPIETIFSFIFSSNNNIQRITTSLLKLRQLAGVKICNIIQIGPEKEVEVEEKGMERENDSVKSSKQWILRLHSGIQSDISTIIPSKTSKTSKTSSISPNDSFKYLIQFQATLCLFPTISALSQLTEEQLRNIGSGYRAPYILKTANMLQEDLSSLQNNTIDSATDHMVNNTLNNTEIKLNPLDMYRFRHKEFSPEYVIEKLSLLSGIGRKVASCIALFSMDKLQVIPVDTHVYKLLMHDYKIDVAKYAGILPQQQGNKINTITHYNEFQVDTLGEVEQKAVEYCGKQYQLDYPRNVVKDTKATKIAQAKTVKDKTISVSTTISADIDESKESKDILKKLLLSVYSLDDLNGKNNNDTILAKINKVALTPKHHNAIEKFFQWKFGPVAGWAHSILFTSDLPKYQLRLPDELRIQMGRLTKADVLAKEQTGKQNDKQKGKEKQVKGKGKNEKNVNADVGVDVGADTDANAVVTHQKKKKRGVVNVDMGEDDQNQDTHQSKKSRNNTKK